MIRKCMMGTAGQIAGKTVLERRACRQQGPACGKAGAPPERLRPGQAEPSLLGARQSR